MRQPAKNTLRLEIRVGPELLRAIKVCAVMDGESESRWLRRSLGRVTARRIRRASVLQYRAAKRVLAEEVA